MKKILCAFLAILMLAACMALSFPASAENDVAELHIKGIIEPAVGAKVNTSVSGISLETKDSFTQDLYITVFYCEGAEIDKNKAFTGIFEAGKVYSVYVGIYLGEYDEKPFTDSKIYMNDIELSRTENEVSYSDDTLEITYTFPQLKASDASTPEGACKWCGKVHGNDLWQKITAFFHRIFAGLFGARI